MLRDTAIGVSTNLKHVSWFNCVEDTLRVFDPIMNELNSRITDSGNGSLFDHHISERAAHTRASYFETTTLLTDSMQEQLNIFLQVLPDSDGKERQCIRSLANYYNTTIQRSSKDCMPLLKVHRDNVNNADLSIVLGTTLRSEYRGSLLYVSTVASTGKVHFNKDDSPCRKSVVGIDMCRGVCAVLKHNVEHYVSALQSGQRCSLVFHMSPK